MRVGILTQHFLRNYGGIVQNWALQQVLISLGHEPLTLEHDTCYSRTRWLMGTAKQIVKRKSWKGLPAYPYKGRVGHRLFIDFIDSHINSTAIRIFTQAIEQRYGIEAFVVGSDQVWRPAFNVGRLYNMYLDFVGENAKKVAYAASFGVSDWEYSEKEAEQCKALAKRFDAISVREETGINLCRQHLDVEACLALDPILLLNDKDYLSLCCDIPIENDFVFVYALHLNDKMLSFAHRMADKYGKRIKVLQAGDKLHPDDSIEKWIASFRDATVVVTDSFHGMALSVVFHKPFFTFKNESGGQERISSFLSQYGLTERLVDEGQEYHPQDIDWDIIDRTNGALRLASIEFLKKSLS